MRKKSSGNHTPMITGKRMTTMQKNATSTKFRPWMLFPWFAVKIANTTKMKKSEWCTALIRLVVGLEKIGFALTENERRAKMNDNTNYGCAVNACDPAPCGGMKQTVMILSDEVRKARELIFEIQKELFGDKPQNPVQPHDIMCAQDALDECKSIAEQNLEILNDILRGING